MVLKGKLNEEQIRDLDGLILRLKGLNVNHIIDGECKKRLALTDIRPLPAAENDRLWQYIRHCCKLATMTNNSLDKLRKLCRNDSRLDMNDLVNDAINDMSIHVYRYVWRKYRPSNDVGYVINTSFQGFKTWHEKQCEKICFDRKALNTFDMFKSALFDTSAKVCNNVKN